MKSAQVKASLLVLLASGVLWLLLPPHAGLMARAFIDRQFVNRPVPDQSYSVDRALAEENARLQSLLALGQRLEGRTTLARVVSRAGDTWWSHLDVVLHTEELPTSSALVLTGEGLLGTIAEGAWARHDSGRTLARVELLSAPGRQISVLVGSQERPFLSEGHGTEVFTLRAVTSDQSPLPVGSVVKTAGQGEDLVKGLVVANLTGPEQQPPRATTAARTPSEVLIWWR